MSLNWVLHVWLRFTARFGLEQTAKEVRRMWNTECGRIAHGFNGKIEYIRTQFWGFWIFTVMSYEEL